MSIEDLYDPEKWTSPYGKSNFEKLRQPVTNKVAKADYQRPSRETLTTKLEAFRAGYWTDLGTLLETMIFEIENISSIQHEAVMKESPNPYKSKKEE